MYLQLIAEEATDQGDSSDNDEGYIDYGYLESHGQMTLPFDQDSELQR